MKAKKHALHPNANDLTGHRYGRYTVVSLYGRDKSGRVLWTCRCDCGVIKNVLASNLRNGNCQSCGCMARELASIRNTCHGHRVRKTSEYTSWVNLQGRCRNTNNGGYSAYGGRGIRVCRRWSDSFTAFLDDMGTKPTSKHQIDRKNNDGHYSCGKCGECIANGWPANCRWATATEQAMNRRSNRLITYEGQAKAIRDWSKICGIPEKVLRNRIWAGWSVQRALTRPYAERS